MSDLEQSVRQICAAYSAAVYAKDVGAFVALYDPEVHVFDMWGEWSYDGLGAWRGMVIAWFGSLGDERVKVEMEGIETLAGDDIGVAYGFITYKGLSAQGKELRAMQNRFTWVLRRRDGAWKIAHEHSSAPIDFETSKVILQR